MTEKEYTRLFKVSDKVFDKIEEDDKEKKLSTYQVAHLSIMTKDMRIQADIARQFTIANEHLKRIAGAMEKKIPHIDLDYTDKYELLAKLFYGDTGMLAPGKDDMSQPYSYEERVTAFKKWLKENGYTPSKGGD